MRLVRHVLLVLVAATLVACPGAVTPPTPLGDGTVAVALNGRAVTFRAPAGTTLGKLTLLIGGKTYTPTADGKITVPASALAQAEKAGGVTVLASGFAPLRLTPGQLTGTVQLAPAVPIASTGSAGAGKPLEGGGLTLELPATVLRLAGPVGVSSYAVPIDKAWEDRARATDKAIGRETCAIGAGPCVPVKASLGLLVTVDGPLTAGKAPLTIDLASWAAGADPQRAEFAKTILASQATMTPAQLAALAERYGVTFEGSVMHIAVGVGDAARSEGAVRVELDGLAGLGVALEITLVSAVGTALPPGVRPSTAPGTPSTAPGTGPTPVPFTPGGPPPPVVSGGLPTATPVTLPAESRVLLRDGGILFSANTPLLSDAGSALTSKVRLISDAGSNLISDLGGSIISSNGAAIVPGDLVAGFAPNGGALTGTVRVPNNQASYQLLAAFPVIRVGALTVALPFVPGVPTAEVNADGLYRFPSLPATGPTLVVMVRVDNINLMMTLAPAPRGGDVTADIDPDTTAVAAEGLLQVAAGCSDPRAFYPPGFQTAVARVSADPTFDLPQWGRLQRQLFESPPSFGPPWSNDLGVTFSRDGSGSISALATGWKPLVTAPIGGAVEFHISGIASAGPFDHDYRGEPSGAAAADNSVPGFPYGAVVVRWPGQPPRLFPDGETGYMAGGGLVEMQYTDRIGNYNDNSGSHAVNYKVTLRSCP